MGEGACWSLETGRIIFRDFAIQHFLMEISTAVIIGTGNVSWALALALAINGIKIRAVYDRNIGKAEDLVSLINQGGAHAQAIDRLEDILPDAGLYLISVSDKAVTEVSKALPQVSGIVAHTAGGVSIDALECDSQGKGVFYPLQTFTKGRDMSFEGLPVFVEGSDSETYNALSGLAHRLGADCHEANSLQRRHIHLAGVFANNFVNLMLGYAGEEARKAGFSPEVLRPIVDETVSKYFDMGADAAQTGPARRNDEAVMNTHLNLIDSEEQKNLYREISHCITKKYRK